jgi:hypothetical protein
MNVTTKRVLAPVLVAALLGALPAGCGLGGGGDKAGGSSAPTVLRLAAADDADQPDARFVRYFASRVAELSGGSLRVRPVWDAAGQQDADYEARIVRTVREGEFELGWLGARAWDRLGITHFQALQAPFLVTSHTLLGRIATGSVGERMLAGLDGIGLVGLALAPDRLRYPFGVHHALARVPLAHHGGAHAGAGRHARAGQRRRPRRRGGATRDRRRRGLARDQLGERGRELPHHEPRAVPEGAHAVRRRRRVPATRRGSGGADPESGS